MTIEEVLSQISSDKDEYNMDIDSICECVHQHLYNCFSHAYADITPELYMLREMALKSVEQDTPFFRERILKKAQEAIAAIYQGTDTDTLKYIKRIYEVYPYPTKETRSRCMPIHVENGVDYYDFDLNCQQTSDLMKRLLGNWEFAFMR